MFKISFIFPGANELSVKLRNFLVIYALFDVWCGWGHGGVAVLVPGFAVKKQCPWELIHNMCSKIIFLKLLTYLPDVNELMTFCVAKFPNWKLHHTDPNTVRSQNIGGTLSHVFTKKHPIAHPWGWAMGCLLRIQCLTYVMALSMWSCMQHDVISNFYILQVNNNINSPLMRLYPYESSW